MFGRKVTETVRNGNAGCGHTRHIGSCPFCQRTRAARYVRQLADATVAGANWRRTHR